MNTWVNDSLIIIIKEYLWKANAVLQMIVKGHLPKATQLILYWNLGSSEVRCAYGVSQFLVKP